MTAPEAAAELGTNRTGISNLEAGRFGASAERVRTLARIYACPDKAYIDALAAMAEERVKGWWEEYRGSLPVGWLDLAELEHHAVSLRSMQSMHMPGLLHTEEYAKAVFATAVPELAPVELRRRLSHRMKRRDILDREPPLHCTFLVHEAALRMQTGGSKVAGSQLTYLAEASERDNITVRAITFAAGGFPHAGGSVLYAAGPVPRLDTVQMDTGHGEVLIDADAHLSNYRAILDRIEELCLTPEETRDLILKIVRDS
jgi:hypothetical protein